VASGIVVDDRGHVVTLASALYLPGRILVQPPDEPGLDAKLVGVDESLNLAVLKAVGGRLTPAPLAKNPDLRTGKMVASVANPYGLQGSLSIGLISGLDRYLESLTACYAGLIQVTNPIHPGEMGGALVDLQGNIIGMLCYRYDDHGKPGQNLNDVNFAIPMDRVWNSASQLIEKGKVLHGWLGVTVASPQDGSHGAVMVAMEPDSPALQAGLKPGDLIVGIDNREVPHPQTLQSAVLASLPGTSMSLTVLRDVDGKEERLQKVVRLGQAPEITHDALAGAEPAWLGAGFEDLTREFQAAYTPNIASGVLVAQTVSGSLAETSDLRPGDVIVRVAGRTVLNLRNFSEYLSQCRVGQEVEIWVHRGGALVPVRLRLPPPPPGMVSYWRPSGTRLAPESRPENEREVDRLRDRVSSLQNQLRQLEQLLREMQTPPKAP
jgi:S1-C subfamily serine protease